MHYKSPKLIRFVNEITDEDDGHEQERRVGIQNANISP